MEVQAIVTSWEVLVYIKRSRKTNSMCQLQRKLNGVEIHCPTLSRGWDIPAYDLANETLPRVVRWLTEDFQLQTFQG